MDTLKGSTNIIDGSDEGFMDDVIEASKDIPIIVDFWAPWCGPCKTLGPALETAVGSHNKKIKLVKIDIDKHPAVASQLRVQSIPAVFAFSNGQPVDGFMGAQTAAQVTEFIDKIIDKYGAPDDNIEAEISIAQNMIFEKRYDEAFKIFSEILKQEPNSPEAHAGLLKALIGMKDYTSAKQAVERLPNNLLNNVEIKTAIAQLHLAEQTSTAGDIVTLRKKHEKSPNDVTIMFDLAIALISEQENEEAINLLLEIVKNKPEWNEGKAKTQLIEFLDSLGPKSSEGKKGRRRLSSILFA